ncbi:MAG: riboflavin biosynthesis protein RibF, partial [Bacteroidota bacterium]
IPFTREFSQQSPDAYIQDFLIDKFHPACVVIGYDHRFGKNREGDIAFLRKFAEDQEQGFQLVEIAKEEVEDIAVSSTKIRKALEHGDVSTAAHFLNHYYSFNGTVVHGQQIGKTLGFPTANLELIGGKYKLIPPQGIYAAYATHQGKRYEGMLYIGNRPTLKAYDNRTIEINLFDFDKEIYGDKLQVELVAYLREDQQFKGLEALSEQLGRDKESALAVFKKKRPSVAAKPLPSAFPAVAIVILNYNGRQYLEQFLPSLHKSTYANFQIHLADNGSSDDSIEWLTANYPDIQIHDLKENHGFAQGYNLALEALESDYFVLLNSDVEVSPNWIEPIIDLMEKEANIGACQPKVLAYHHRDHFEHAGAAGGWIDHLGYPFCRGRMFDTVEKDQGQYDQVSEIFWASGAAFFVRPQLFKALGGFDGDYFAHMEEIDLCWRIKKAGYRVVVQPESRVYHVGGGTLAYGSPRKVYLNIRNSLFTLLKNEESSKLYWLIPLRLVLDGLAGLLFFMEGKFKHIWAIVRAHWSFFGQFGYFRRKRALQKDQIQKVSIASPSQLTGVYHGSVVWQYYLRRKRSFKKL